MAWTLDIDEMTNAQAGQAHCLTCGHRCP